MKLNTKKCELFSENSYDTIEYTEEGEIIFQNMKQNILDKSLTSKVTQLRLCH